MKILGINMSHDASACVLEDGHIIYYCEEERLNHQKQSSSWIKVFGDAYHKHAPFDHIAVSFTAHELKPYFTREDINKLIEKLDSVASHFGKETNTRTRVHVVEHHRAHAFQAFYNSGFDEAAVLVMDGGGSSFSNLEDRVFKESESIFKFSYNIDECLWKRGHSLGTRYHLDYQRPQQFKEYEWYVDSISFGKAFNWGAQIACNDSKGAGKLMGLAAYGKDDPKHPKAFDDYYPIGMFYHNTWKKKVELSNEDLAYRIQTDSYIPTLNYVKRALTMGETKNICLVGGYFFNVVNNYKLVKDLPDVNIYVEPMAGDMGCSIGAAYKIYRDETNDMTINPCKTLYLGNQANYDMDLKQGERTARGVTSAGVARLLEKGNVVALYQGKAEAGPRALGNRSILYDPRDPNGRDVVNKIKKREWYRPFAGSVMEEHAGKWFNMAGMSSSPFMMYAVECFREKQKLVPALQHNDGTSRIQTVSKQQNPHYYDLIKEFYKLTGVPMVMNTSFNLAGDTMVDTMQDALKTCREGRIPYLYCPERQLLIEFKQTFVD